LYEFNFTSLHQLPHDFIDAELARLKREIFSVKPNIIFCLGDRFEMLAAVLSGVSFGIKFAHIHGGEKTLGAIDNVFRHSITHASYIHILLLTVISHIIETSSHHYISHYRNSRFIHLIDILASE
jgi:GDP/UDP-N,N'-diacetylbacillosamine 2-epimerase (hydrolysing)